MKEIFKNCEFIPNYHIVSPVMLIYYDTIQKEYDNIYITKFIKSNNIDYDLFAKILQQEIEIKHPTVIIIDNDKLKKYIKFDNKIICLKDVNWNDIQQLLYDKLFTHLHSHNSFSLKDGIGTPKRRIDWLVKNGYYTIATTNHGNIADWYYIYELANKFNLKPILGIEAYVNRQSELFRQHLNSDAVESLIIRKKLSKETFHLTIIAKNIYGYNNLIKLHNDAWINGFYRNPIMSVNQLKTHYNGLIVLSGCSNGEQNKLIAYKYYLQSEQRQKDIKELIINKIKLIKLLYKKGLDNKILKNKYLDNYDVEYYKNHKKLDLEDYKKFLVKTIINTDKQILQTIDNKIEQIVLWYKEIFQDDYYLELMLLEDYPIQQKINNYLIKLSQKFNIKTVITNDVHYLKKGDHIIQQIQMLNDQQKTFKDVEKGNAWTIKAKDLYFKTVKDLYNSYINEYKNDIFTENIFWESINNVLEIINKIEFFKIDDTIKLPKIVNHSEEILAKLITKGLKEKKLINKKEYVDRAKFEFQIITKKGYTDYFLVVKDFIDYAKNNFGELSIGPGRGSAAGSLINYLIGITKIDPLKHNLLFERFLSYSRKDYPDIDCLYEKTLIKTKEGLKLIKDVKIGDIVYDLFNHEQQILNKIIRKANKKQEELFVLVIKHDNFIGEILVPGHHRLVDIDGYNIFTRDIKVPFKLANNNVVIGKYKYNNYNINLVDIKVSNNQTFQIYPFVLNYFKELI